MSRIEGALNYRLSSYSRIDDVPDIRRIVFAHRQVSHLQGFRHVALGDSLTSAVAQPRDPVAVFVNETIDKAVPHDDGSVQLYKLAAAEQLKKRMHCFVKQPALPLRVDPNVIPFGDHLVDQ